MPKGPQGKKQKPLTDAQKRRLWESLDRIWAHLVDYHRQRAAQYKDPKYTATALTEQRKADNRAKRIYHLGKAAEYEQKVAERKKQHA